MQRVRQLDETSSEANGDTTNDWRWLDEIRGQFDEDALASALEQPEMQEREGLSELFAE